MQSLDLYMMICHPLNYEKFKETKNVVKMLLIGSFICLAAACDNLIPIFVEIKYSFATLDENVKSFSTQESIVFGVGIFSAVKMTSMKLVYTKAIIKMAIRSRNELRHSAEMSNSQNKIQLYRRLFLFTLIPVFLSLLFTVQESFFVLELEMQKR